MCMQLEWYELGLFQAPSYCMNHSVDTSAQQSDTYTGQTFGNLGSECYCTYSYIQTASVAFEQQHLAKRNSPSCLPYISCRWDRYSFVNVGILWNMTYAWRGHIWDPSELPLIGIECRGRLGKYFLTFEEYIDVLCHPLKHRHCISCNGRNQYPDLYPFGKCCSMGNGKLVLACCRRDGKCDKSTSRMTCRVIRNLNSSIYLELVEVCCTSYTWLPWQHIYQVARLFLSQDFLYPGHNTVDRCTIVQKQGAEAYTSERSVGNQEQHPMHHHGMLELAQLLRM